MRIFKKNESVQWKWMGQIIVGQVIEIFFEPTVKVIKSKNIKRKGSKENPAYLVQSKAGNIALKLQSELKPNALEQKKEKLKPRIFSGDE